MNDLGDLFEILTFPVIILICAFTGLMVRWMNIKFKAMEEAAQQKSQGVIAAKDAENAELRARVEKLERRMANVETIVIEAEKKKEFELL